MKREITIAKATNKYRQQIIDLISKHYNKFGDKVNLNFYDKDLADIEKNYTAKGHIFFVVLDNTKKLIGTIAVIFHPDKTAEIKRIYLDEAFHGKGIALNLLNSAFEQIKNKKICKVFLWSDKRYKRAHAFFRKHNFHPVLEQQFFDADNPYIAIKFELDLCHKD